MLKSLNQATVDQMNKMEHLGRGNWGHGGRPGSVGGSSSEGGAGKEEMARPAMRRLSEREAFTHYVKIKEGAWGGSATAKALNAKVGMCEGFAKAYRERAGKMKEGDTDKNGRTRDQLLSTAKKMQDAAERVASERDSHLGRLAQKMLKQDLSEQEIMDMIEAGEFDDAILAELSEELGIPMDELKGDLGK